MNTKIGIRAALACALAFSGCASETMEGEVPRRDDAGLRRTVAVALECSPDGFYGTREEWTSDVLDAIWAEELCPAAWESGDAGSWTPDITVTVAIRRSEAPAEPDVETQGALLGVLAWSTIPFLPWWISDVNLDPGVEVSVDWELQVSGKEGARIKPPAPRWFKLEPILTDLRERYPLFSWSTLGQVFLPPVLFKQGDPEQIQESLAPEVRRRAALEVARILATTPFVKKELIESLEVRWIEDQAFLCFAPSSDLYHLSVQVPGSTRKIEKIVKESSGGAEPLALKSLLSGPEAQGKILKVLAYGPEGALPYSVAVPERVDAEEK